MSALFQLVQIFILQTSSVLFLLFGDGDNVAQFTMGGNLSGLFLLLDISWRLISSDGFGDLS